MGKRIILVAVILLGFVFLIHQKSEQPSSSTTLPKQPAQKTFNPKQYSTTDPSSVWVVVNKRLPLVPPSYEPADLVAPTVDNRVASTRIRQIMAPAMNKLFAAAAANGTGLRLSSGYRSYGYQVGLYNGYVAKEGQAAADAQSARPGFSEHQTGLAIDVSPSSGVCEVQACFATTPAGQWVAANAYKYGFIIRYPEGLTATTGYTYEPWHLRYVGNELAGEMHKRGVKTLEEFFKLPAAPDYAAN